jgi:hypothetical protein
LTRPAAAQVRAAGFSTLPEARQARAGGSFRRAADFFVLSRRRHGPSRRGDRADRRRGSGCRRPGSASEPAARAKKWAARACAVAGSVEKRAALTCAAPGGVEKRTARARAASGGIAKRPVSPAEAPGCTGVPPACTARPRMRGAYGRAVVEQEGKAVRVLVRAQAEQGLAPDAGQRPLSCLNRK